MGIVSVRSSRQERHITQLISSDILIRDCRSGCNSLRMFWDVASTFLLTYNQPIGRKVKRNNVGVFEDRGNIEK